MAKSKNTVTPPQSPTQVDLVVGENLRQARIRRGQTLSDVSEAMGISHQQFQKYETGANRLSAGMIDRAATVLCVSIASFFVRPEESQKAVKTGNRHARWRRFGKRPDGCLPDQTPNPSSSKWSRCCWPFRSSERSNANDKALYGGSHLQQPMLEYGGAGLDGTASDYMNFAQMLLGSGQFEGRQVLSAEAVGMMTSSQLPASLGDAPLAASGRGAGTGFGLCGYVNISRPEGAPPGEVGEYGWSGWASTAFWIDPQNELAGLVFTQVIPDDIGSIALCRKVREAIYAGPGLTEVFAGPRISP